MWTSDKREGRALEKHANRPGGQGEIFRKTRAWGSKSQRMFQRWEESNASNSLEQEQEASCFLVFNEAGHHSLCFINSTKLNSQKNT